MNEKEENRDKKKGLIITLIVHAILVILFFIIGLGYTEPKPENGFVINFGNSATGMGDETDGAQTSSVSQPEQSQPQVEEVVNAQDNPPVMTQNTVDAPSVNAKASKPVETEKKPVEKKPTPSDELSKLLQDVANSKSGGEGVEQGSGDQGDPDGDRDSPNRTGDGGGGGTGGDGNYMLGNRQALSKPVPESCSDNNDVGRVVVKIYVNRDGKVTRAIPGERIPKGKASTTTSSCLFSEAKTAAMRTTWQADPEAPPLQIGYIIYNFGKN